MLNKRPTAGNINSTILPPSQKNFLTPNSRIRNDIVYIDHMKIADVPGSPS